MDRKSRQTVASKGIAEQVSIKPLKYKGILHRFRHAVPGLSARITAPEQGRRDRRHKSYSRKTSVNGDASAKQPTLTATLLMGYLVMMKRILFFTLTAFVVSLPITGIWSLSLNQAAEWEQRQPSVANNEAQRSVYVNSMNQYIRSLRYLIGDNESFGPFT